MRPTNTDRRRWASLLLVPLMAVTLAACGGDDDNAEEATATTAVAAEGEAVTINGIDYGYENVPESVRAGTELKLMNQSDREVHEIVAARVNDGEQRSDEEILQLSQEEILKVAEIRGVVIAFPGEEGFAPQGPLVLEQPGRYLLVCMIPTGADPQAYREAAAQPSEGPPQVDGGPPHIANGMWAPLTVEG